MKKAVWLLLPLLLNGCLLDPVLEGMEESVRQTRLSLKRMSGVPEYPEAERDRVPFAIYCYRTIGTVDCYSRPQEGQEYRLVGVGQARSLDASRVPFTLNSLGDGGEGKPQSAGVVGNEARGTQWAAAPVPMPKPAVPVLKDGKEVPVELIEFQIGDKVYNNQNVPSAKSLDEQAIQQLQKDLKNETWLGRDPDQPASDPVIKQAPKR